MGRKLNLKPLRESRGWSQRQLADKAGVSPGAVAQWELGLTIPSVTNLLRLTSLFGVSMDDLFTKDEQAPA